MARAAALDDDDDDTEAVQHSHMRDVYVQFDAQLLPTIRNQRKM